MRTYYDRWDHLNDQEWGAHGYVCLDQLVSDGRKNSDQPEWAEDTLKARGMVRVTLPKMVNDPRDVIPRVFHEMASLGVRLKPWTSVSGQGYTEIGYYFSNADDAERFKLLVASV